MSSAGFFFFLIDEYGFYKKSIQVRREEKKVQKDPQKHEEMNDKSQMFEAWSIT